MHLGRTLPKESPASHIRTEFSLTLTVLMMKTFLWSNLVFLLSYFIDFLWRGFASPVPQQFRRMKKEYANSSKKCISIKTKLLSMILLNTGGELSIDKLLNKLEMFPLAT